MSKTISLRTELQRKLKTLTTTVYYEEASDSAVYPYCVFELSELLTEANKTVYQLEINLLDHGVSTSAIEILADNIQKSLNKYFFVNAEIEFKIYQGIRQTVKEEDKQIIRRRLLFEIQLHEVRGDNE